VFMPGRERPVDRQSDVHSSIIFILVEIPFWILYIRIVEWRPQPLKC
jgi:hypothetical protein